MAQFYNTLTDHHRRFIQNQHLFFTASAPVSGRINLSPKGMDSFRIIDNKTVAYLDLTGSGNETAAHILENQRLTIMMCSFDKEPLIFRMYGKGEVIEKDSSAWHLLIPLFDSIEGMRQIIQLHIENIQTSCGFGVPLYEFQGDRQTLLQWAKKKGKDGLTRYRQDKNSISIDGAKIPLDY